ncbi:MAG: HlyD family efflux transporter periplasmic adaptor subunit [Chloroflexi bacterium]|nr:HlyD family efflux transporter periplasmic adaptor subunit [Chloroflexota bacterium]
MHNRMRKIGPVVIVVAAVTAVLIYLYNVSGAEESGALQASGTVEAVEVIIAPELAGYVVEILADEGDAVAAGDVLFRLEDDIMQAQRGRALAALETAQAQLTMALAGATPEDLAAAEAVVAAARGSVAAAEAALTQAEINAESARVVEETESSVMAAEAAVAQAEAQVAIAQANLAGAQAHLARLQTGARPEEIAALQAQVNQAEAQRLLAESVHFADFIDRGIGGWPEERARYQLDSAAGARDAAQARLDLANAGVASQDIAAAVAVVNAAQAQVAFAEAGVDAAQARLAQSQAAPEMTEDQVAVADAGVQAARVQVEIAKGQLAQAEAQRDRLSLGVTAEEVAVLESQVAQAEAELTLIDTQMEKLAVRTAVSGVILTRHIQPGEVVQPGAVAFTLVQLDELTITVFVTEERYGQISLGQSVEVTVDSFPGETFAATVTRIADEAEFTPRNVQTEDGRRTTVFAVKLSVEDTNGKLKPGMPADVTIND